MHRKETLKEILLFIAVVMAITLIAVVHSNYVESFYNK